MSLEPDVLETRARSGEYGQLVALLAEIKGTDRLAPGEVARLERVRLLLAGQGIELSDSRSALWLAPVMCATGSQQKIFYERFAALFGLAREALPASRVEAPVMKPIRRQSWWRRRWRWLVLGAIVISVLGGIAARLLNRAPSTAAPTEPNLAQSIWVLITGQRASTPPDSVFYWVFVGLIALVLVVLVLVARTYWKARWRRLNDWAPDHLPARSLASAAALPFLYGDTALRRRLIGLRRHRIVPSPRIHIRRSIRATIRAGGRPVLVYGTRPLTPDYVLLVDRSSPRDHFTILAQSIARRFTNEGAPCVAYEFFGDPCRLRRSYPVEEEVELSLDRVIGRHNGARLLVLAEPMHLLDEAGRAEPWLSELGEQRSVLLNPRPEECWDWREAEIGRCGLLLFSALPAGLAQYADAMRARAESRAPLPPGSQKGAFDLATVLDRHRAALIQGSAPPQHEVAELLGDLEASLGERAMVLLRAAAVFPLVEPSLTALLGSQLKDGEGKPLLTEEALIAVARLPWMRLGRIPDWLRQPLARGLTSTQLELTTATIYAFLNPVAGRDGRLKLNFAEIDDVAVRARLIEWIRNNPTSPYNDPLMIDAVAGKLPHELARSFDPAANLRQVLAKLDSTRHLVASLATMMLVFSLAVLQPGRADVEQATRKIRPPSRAPVMVNATGERIPVSADQPETAVEMPATNPQKPKTAKSVPASNPRKGPGLEQPQGMERTIPPERGGKGSLMPILEQIVRKDKQPDLGQQGAPASNAPNASPRLPLGVPSKADTNQTVRMVGPRWLSDWEVELEHPREAALDAAVRDSAAVYNQYKAERIILIVYSPPIDEYEGSARMAAESIEEALIAQGVPASAIETSVGTNKQTRTITATLQIVGVPTTAK